MSKKFVGCHTSGSRRQEKTNNVLFICSHVGIYMCVRRISSLSGFRCFWLNMKFNNIIMSCTPHHSHSHDDDDSVPPQHLPSKNKTNCWPSFTTLMYYDVVMCHGSIWDGCPSLSGTDLEVFGLTENGHSIDLERLFWAERFCCQSDTLHLVWQIRK